MLKDNKAIHLFHPLHRDKLEALKALQKMRARQKGVSAASLALGKKIPKTEEVSDVRLNEQRKILLVLIMKFKLTWQNL